MEEDNDTGAYLYLTSTQVALLPVCVYLLGLTRPGSAGACVCPSSTSLALLTLTSLP